HPSIEAAVVMAREDVPGDRRLVSYVVRRSSSNGEPPERSGDEASPAGSFSDFVPQLRAWLKSKLPEYMLPSLFVPLEAMPLTPNGKVDRKSLPALEQVRPALQENFVAPRTSTETMLAEIWCEVLGLDKVGVHDNFFELGGHSLMVIQVISRLRETVQLELSMQQFFETPAITALAEVIEGILVREISELSDEETEALLQT